MSRASKVEKSPANILNQSWQDNMVKEGKVAHIEDGEWVGPEDGILFAGYPVASFDKGTLLQPPDMELIPIGKDSNKQCLMFVRADRYELPAGVEVVSVEEPVAEDTDEDTSTADSV